MYHVSFQHFSISGPAFIIHHSSFILALAGLLCEFARKGDAFHDVVMMTLAAEGMAAGAEVGPARCQRRHAEGASLMKRHSHRARNGEDTLFCPLPTSAGGGQRRTNEFGSGLGSVHGLSRASARDHQRLAGGGFGAVGRGPSNVTQVVL